jgi:hypothetical protein
MRDIQGLTEDEKENDGAPERARQRFYLLPQT